MHPAHAQGTAASLGRPVLPPPEYLRLPLHFTGTAGEYFRIWVVNVALTILTLGFFLPWARVRQRGYLYGHTQIAGHGFEYTADPKALLRGYLLIGTLFLLFNVTLQLGQSDIRLFLVSAGLALLFAVTFPWLIMKSLRFAAHNSRFRNIRFHFSGRAGGAYTAYMAVNILASVTFGLAMPLAWYMQRKYQLNHLSYGETPFRYEGDVGDFFLIALKAFGVSIGAGLLTFGSFALVGFLLFSGDEAPGAGRIILAGLSALPGLLTYGLARQYVRAGILQHLVQTTHLGGARLESRINIWMLSWIGVSNLLVQLLTLGLATPWATVRWQRYITDHLDLLTTVPLDEFRDRPARREGALGEAATDLLGLEIGL